ncbi:unnamed protein product [Ceutorhynchus assimilis]|uniref:Uncharacterized protein n=1 Tax=Ceutorhynchus assimilis TaxID=467358 RepID=A0A9N9MAU7_9CUCU|nr:unnamed protein product [Ceutorhynchus assimilis]
MRHFDFYKHRGRGHCHDRHYHKRDRKHGGKFCEKFGKRGHHFKDMLCSMGDLATANPQDPDIEEKVRSYVKEFFDRSFLERQAGMENSKENEAGEGTSKAAANRMCMWKERGRHCGSKGCQYCQTAGRNISEEKTQNTSETEGKKSEGDTEEIPYCQHLDHHHRGYGRRHHEHGECRGRCSGDESSTRDEQWMRRGRRHHHDHRDHHHHDRHGYHHHERHGYNHHGRMGWNTHGCDCFHNEATATVKNADSGLQEPNQEVGGSEMQVDPAPAQENEEESQQEVQEVADSLRKSSLE